MNIFIDLHHSDLNYSLQLLFEKRLGYTVYRPIGLEWYHERYWHVFPHIDTAKQFLGLDQATELPKDIHGNILPVSARVNHQYIVQDGIYYVTDTTKEECNRGITLDKFKEMKFDILVSSIPAHIAPFNDLIKRYQPQAKHIFQVGNAWGYLQGVHNILASTAPFHVPPGINACFYHQEFNLDMFNYEPPASHTTVHSFIHYMQRKDFMNRIASQLPGWVFKSHGAGMEDCIHKTRDEAQAFKNAAFIWHYKPEGDGYGYAVHRAGAVGRPLIIWGSQYRGKLGSQLMTHGETCIDVEQTTDLVKALQFYSEPKRHQRMCENMHNRFKQVVDFNREEQQIKEFISKLV